MINVEWSIPSNTYSIHASRLPIHQYHLTVIIHHFPTVYSKQETSRIRQQFWTSFGQYMKPVPAASGEKVNWSNYKTGIGHVYFRLSAEKAHASIAIELAGTSSVRETQFEQLVDLIT